MEILFDKMHNEPMDDQRKESGDQKDTPKQEKPVETPDDFFKRITKRPDIKAILEKLSRL